MSPAQKTTLPTASAFEASGRFLAAEKHMLSQIASGERLGPTLEVLCRTVEELSDGEVLTSVLLVDGKQLRHGAAPSLPKAWCDAIDGMEIGPAAGSCGSAAFSGKPVIAEDVRTDPRWAAFVDLANQHGLRACWSVPILAESKVLGTFALYYREPRTPSSRDVEIVEWIAVIARVAIERHSADRDRAELVAHARASQTEAEAERANLRQFIRDAPAILCLLRGPTHVYEVANPPYLQLVGHREILGKPIREALPELAGQGFYELLDGVYQTGEKFVGNELPAVVTDARGQARQGFFNFVYQATRDGSGRVDGIAVYAHDVTEFVNARKKLAETLQSESDARAAAQASEQQFRTLFNSMPQLGWTARADGFIDFYNDGWYRYTGTTYEQMQGWGWRTVHDPEMLPKVIARWEQSLASGTRFEMEFPLRRHDGVFRWFLTRVNPLRDAEGKLIRWVGVNTDVDDVRAARALSEEVAEQSRNAEAMLLQMREAKETAERRLAELQEKQDA